MAQAHTQREGQRERGEARSSPLSSPPLPHTNSHVTPPSTTPPLRSRPSLRETVDKTPIEELADKVRQYLHLPDPGILYTVMGAAAANMIRGNNVWLMLVGPPSVGKTELLYSLMHMPRVYAIDDISGPAAFLSGTSKKERAKTATGGLLRQVGGHGCILIDDFTSVLSMSSDRLREIMSSLRGMYKGRWIRQLGSDGGMELEWQGKVALLGGCTDEIDRAHAANQAMGERWVYYRHEPDDIAIYEMCRRALKNTREDEWQKKLRDAVVVFFMALGLEWSQDKLPETGRELGVVEMQRVIKLAFVAAKCRSSLARDYDKQVIGVKSGEVATRLATVLGQLYMGMEVIGVREEERWRLVQKVALDSMPKIRRVIVDWAWEMGKEKGPGVTMEKLVEVTGCSRQVIDRHIQEMAVYGVIRKDKRGEKSNYLKLTDEVLEELGRVG